MKYAKKLAYFWHIFQFYGKPENSFRKPEISVKIVPNFIYFKLFSPNEKIYSSQKLCRKRKNVEKTNFLCKLKKNFHLAYLAYILYFLAYTVCILFSNLATLVVDDSFIAQRSNFRISSSF